MKKYLALALSLVMLFCLAACGGGSSSGNSPGTGGGTSSNNTSGGSGETIKIGVLLPTSGSYATSGATSMFALNYALDIINNEYGGIQNMGGAKIELVFADTQGDSEVAVAEMERLIEQEGVVMLLGGHNTVVANTLSQYCISYDMPMIMTGAFGNDAYTTPNDVVFHIAGTAAQTPPEDAKKNAWLEEVTGGDFKGGKVYAYVYSADDYGRSAYESLVEGMAAAGTQEIIGIPMETGATDLSSQILKLQGRDDIEYISCNIPMSDSILFVRQLKEYEVAIPIFANGAGFLVADFLDQVGDAGEYICSTATWFPDYCNTTGDPEFSWSVDQACYDTLGYHTDEVFTWSWEGIWTAWDALERAASLDAQDIKQALKETNIMDPGHMALLVSAHDGIVFETVEVGGVTLYNQNPYMTYLWGQARDGVYRIMYPESRASGEYELVYPLPAWDER